MIFSKILIVGVSVYNREDLRDLWGVKYDIFHWQEICLSRNFVTPDRLRVLTDSRCTTKAFTSRLTWLFSDTKKTDRVLLIFGGHGAKVATRDEDGNVAGIHEALCLYDFNWESPFTDELLGKTIKNESVGRARLSALFDCCHSGGLDRGSDNNPTANIIEFPREILPPVDLSYRLEAAKAMGIKNGSFLDSLGENADCIYACKSDEKAWETWANGEFRGAFSFGVERAIQHGAKSFGDLTKHAASVLKDRGFVGIKQQTPQTNNMEATF